MNAAAAVALARSTGDVTENNATEMRLRERQAELDFALAAAELGQWSLNVANLTARRTLRHDQIFGYDTLLPEWTYAMFLEHVVPDDRAAVDACFQESMASGSAWAIECRIRRADGAVRHIWTKGVVRRDDGGVVEQMLGIVGDITERRHAEAILRESEQRFRLVADGAPVLIWESGTDKLCHWFNRPWLDFTGRSMDQEVGNGWTEGVHPDDVERCLQTYTASFDARTPFSMEYRLRRHDGEFRWLIDNGVPRFKSGGEFDGYIGSCVDVTNYKSAEAKLREADTRKNEFLATLAHELRNPLAAISNGLQVMQMAGMQGPAEQARPMMLRQLGQMSRLVEDLLDVSRITTGHLELQHERVELRSVITAALETCRPVLEHQGREVAVNVADEAVFVSGDPMRLAQVVSNLLTNAAKYTHRGGHIRVSVTRDDATAMVTVSDNGIGIPTDMLDRVFGMFAQVGRTLEKTSGGVGIGLSLVRGLVEMHGGTIEARSEGEGKGSEFAVRLPIAADAPRKPGLIETMKRHGSRRVKVLAVDDSPLQLAVLVEQLGGEEFSVSAVDNGFAALDAAEHEEFDAVILDVQMPGMDGLAVARALRANPRTALSRIAMHTTLTENEVRSGFTDYDAFLPKPCNRELLRESIARLVQLPDR